MSQPWPTFVFVPGSWHKPTCYAKLIAVLESQYNIPCSTVTLPSTTGDRNASFKDDVDAARAAITAETSHGRDVIVIAHSYGGMVGNSAIKGLTAPRAAPTTGQQGGPPTGHVIGLILIASGFTLTGVAFMDPFFGRPPPQWKANWETGFADIVVSPRDFFYHDLSPEDAAAAVAELTPHSLKSLYEGREHAYAGWLDLREVWYLGTTEDRGLPVAAQRMTVGLARGMGGNVVHRELRSSHSPFLSMVGETAEVVVEAVESFTGRKVERAVVNGDAAAEPRAKIMIPAVRLLAPITWLRFGLPGLVGRMIGSGVLLYGWVRRLWR